MEYKPLYIKKTGIHIVVLSFIVSTFRNLVKIF